MTHSGPSIVTVTHHQSPAAARRFKNQNPAQFREVKEDLLLLKATSTATLSCLGECLHLIQQSRYQNSIPSWHGPKSHSSENIKNGLLSSLPSSDTNLTWPIIPSMPQDYSRVLDRYTETGPPETEEELTDTEDNEEEDLGVMDDQFSVILHFISQLKLGMDLTKVVLPTFILEKRSLLEMYANFMAHPDLFLSIAATFHEGRKGAVAKKPYNPVLGEVFHCGWDVPKDNVKSFRTQSASKETATPLSSSGEAYKLRFVAEQVSHHPPVSCFYCECKEKKMCVNAHVWTKSKFLGMSVGVSMVGEGILRLMEHSEESVFTLPSAYVRSILTVPWVELGYIMCQDSPQSYSRPFYGGKVHRATAEVKHNPTNRTVCKAQGEWNGTLEFIYNNGETKLIDTTKLPIIKKKIRPLEKQGLYESRGVWKNVTNALKSGNIEAASEQKHQLEERQ
ncbi:hypothetical protein XELAEV_18033142mg [Xenopus laevis]|uniref:Oxysterol-binding protein n=1 Tax=Xenopus laevis TaxID=8355 RepID=A0A974CJ26_XENLA|nr:hypothetical protein XELAEV_18033142mg [Xenopus laevis]